VKELLERLLKQLPGYLPEMAQLLAGPKTAMLRWIDEARGDLTRPLVFVGLAIAIGFLLQVPQLAKEQDFTVHASSMGLFKLLALVSLAAIIHLLFRMLGGHAPFSATFSAYLYLVSPLYVVLVVVELASQGVLRAYDPTLAAAVHVDPSLLFDQAGTARRFAETRPDLALAYSLLNYVRLALWIGWFVACWGAFRILHGVSRWRSAAAGLLTTIAFPFYGKALEFILLGMFGLRVPPLL
jgi:hypothetical protein